MSRGGSGGVNGVRDRRRYGIGSLKFLKVSIIGRPKKTLLKAPVQPFSQLL